MADPAREASAQVVRRRAEIGLLAERRLRQRVVRRRLQAAVLLVMCGAAALRVAVLSGLEPSRATAALAVPAPAVVRVAIERNDPDIVRRYRMDERAQVAPMGDDALLVAIKKLAPQAGIIRLGNRAEVIGFEPSRWPAVTQ